MRRTSPSRRRNFALLVAALVGGAAACGHAPRRFPLAPPLWLDPDRNDVPAKPAPRVAADVANAVDQTLLRPLVQLFAFPGRDEAVDVNALDEVPDSSWFENRIGRVPFGPARAARGPCTGPPPVRGPWTVTAIKTEGVTPGFFFTDPDGRRYLLKVDGIFGAERATAAEVIGSRVYYAAGYHVPCNQIVRFRPDKLQLAGGRAHPPSRVALDAVLAAALRLPDGRLRAVVSQLLPGEPLGPARWEGLRPDDPNDVVPHEDRREVRASRLLAAWLNHFDIQESSTLDMWVEEGGRRYVRHCMIDFGDLFGAPHKADQFRRRLGHAHFIDLGQMLTDLLSLGLVARPWYRSTPGPAARVLGYYGWRDFTPSAWRPIHPNPAFARMTARDALWMTRIIVRFSDAHLHAIVTAAAIDDAGVRRYLERALIERRDRIARAYLRRYAPLDEIRLAPAPGGRTQRLCFTDLAIRHAGVDPRGVRYRLSLRAGTRLERELGRAQVRPAPGRSDRTCVPLPLGVARPHDGAPAGAPDDDARRYAVLRIFVRQGPAARATETAIHLYDLGPRRGFVLAGIERPPPPAGGGLE